MAKDLFDNQDKDRERVSFAAQVTCQQEGPGSFTALISSPREVVHGYQIVGEGAFDRQVRMRSMNLPLLADHDQRLASVLGSISRLRRVPDGVTAEGSFHLQTDASRDAYNLFKAGVMTDVSIGAFIVARREANKSEQRRGAREVLTELELFELSAVVMGADKAAKVRTLNSEQTEDAPETEAEANDKQEQAETPAEPDLTGLAASLREGLEELKLARVARTLRTAVSRLKEQNSGKV